MASTVVLLLGGALAAVHFLAGRLRSLRGVPRSRWLSFGGGVSVAYVFVHLLPEVARHQSEVAPLGGPVDGLAGAAAEHVLFVAALVGFSGFYGLEQAAREARPGRRGERIDDTGSTDGPGRADDSGRTGDDGRSRENGRTRDDGRAVGNGPSGDGGRADRSGPAEDAGREEVVGDAETRTSSTVFWSHIGSFAVYNAIIGYLLLEEAEGGIVGGALFAGAMGLHFVVNDFGLQEHHAEAYRRYGRWFLSAAVLAGVAVGTLVPVPTVLIGGTLAFIGGGVVLNVVKEELPESRRSRFGSFAVGVAGYTVLLLLV